MNKVKTLRQFLVQYIEENDLAEPTILSYRNALNGFEKYHGKEIRFAELEKTIDKETGRQQGDLIINHWLSEYSKNVSPYTVKSRKAAILAILADAFDLRVTRYRKMRIKSPRCHETPKDVWTPEELGRLVNECHKLKGRFQSTQLRKNYFAQSLLMAAWDTGLRRADLLRIRWDWIVDSHIFSIVCQKTGKNHVTRFSKPTRNTLLLTFDSWTGDYRELCWPVWFRPGREADRAVTDLFKVPLLRSGLKCSDGVFKKIRRSSATCTKLNGGNATDHLGHSSEAITRKHYLNATVIRQEQEITLPPALNVG